LEEAFKGLGKSFSRPWRMLLKALEEAFEGLGGGF
jgi:hypothetical protein